MCIQTETLFLCFYIMWWVIQMYCVYIHVHTHIARSCCYCPSLSIEVIGRLTSLLVQPKAIPALRESTPLWQPLICQPTMWTRYRDIEYSPICPVWPAWWAMANVFIVKLLEEKCRKCTQENQFISQCSDEKVTRGKEQLNDWIELRMVCLTLCVRVRVCVPSACHKGLTPLSLTPAVCMCVGGWINV